jgi:hypothetical protein
LGTKANVALLGYNAGEISKLALGRVDQDRMRLAAEEQVNWQPAVLGPMSIRPGLKMIAGTKSDLPAQIIPFVRSRNDFAALEFTNLLMRVLISDIVLTRVSTSTTITNGDFSSGTGWTITATPSSGAAGAVSGGLLTLTVSGTGAVVSAARSVSVAGGDTAKEHGIRIIVDSGTATVKIGTSSGAWDLFKGDLGSGSHSIAVTPGATTFYVQLENRDIIPAVVDSIQVEAAGAVELPTTWATADLDYLRWDQSADVIFVADGAHQQRKILRWGARSWGVVKYESNLGPFETDIELEGVTILPGAVTGNTTLTTSAAFWKTTHVGGLVRMVWEYQHVNQKLSAMDMFSDTIKVEGSAAARDYQTQITGTWVGTIKLQRSLTGPDTGFVDIASYTANDPLTTSNDGLTVPAWSRFKFSAYTSGSATIYLATAGGTSSGVARITSYVSSTVVNADVLERLTEAAATPNWYLGLWADEKGWPSAVALFDGRLWWSGKGKEWGSVPDDYENFDPETEGDSGPIERSIGYGPIDYINWLLPLQRLIVGTAGAEISIRSSAFDAPLTPTDFTQRNCSTQGSAPVPPVIMDSRAMFVQASRQRLFELLYNVEANDYGSKDLCRFNPDIAGKSGSLVRLAVARQPDTRVYAVRADGQVAVLLYQPDEQVMAWTRLVSDAASGTVENVYTLPGDEQTAVYFITKRTINGSTKRFHEKVALGSKCDGSPDAHLSDCHVIYSGSSATVMTGLSHLEGQEVVVWGYGAGATTGKDLGTYTVASGQITLSEAVTNACIGLAYEARFKSAKLAYGGQLGTALMQRKIINGLGLLLKDTHVQGVTFGQDYDNLDDLPLVDDAVATSIDTVHSMYDHESMPLPSNWTTDARLCLVAASPRPATILAAVISLNTNDKP